MGDTRERFALSTPEAVLVDGANSVTGAPRQHFPEAGRSLAAFGVVFVVALVLVWRRHRLVPALAAVLGLGALPGAVAVLHERADAPVKRHAVRALVTAGVDDLAAQARWPTAVPTITRDDGDVLFPLARYAWPTRADGGVPLELRGSVLATGCHRDEPLGEVICGVGP